MNLNHRQLAVSRRARAARGVTLIELMVGMVIALIVAGAIGTLYLSSRESFRVANSTNSARESGVSISELLTREVRKAGNYGCFRWKQGAGINLLTTARLPLASAGNYPIPTSVDSVTGNLVPNIGPAFDIRGGDVSGLTLPPTSTIAKVNGSDYVSVAYGQPLAYAIQDMPETDTPIRVRNAVVVASGQPLLISDCDAMQLFRSDSGGTNGAAVTEIQRNAGIDNTAPTNKVFGGVGLKTGAVLMRLASTTLFLGTASGRTSLYSWDTLTGDIQPFAENVIKMKTLYAVDNGGVVGWFSGAAVTSNAWWDRVRGVRLHYVVQGIEATPKVEPKDYVWNATQGEFVPSATAAPGNRIQQAYSVTAAVRGRVEVF